MRKPNSRKVNKRKNHRCNLIEQLEPRQLLAAMVSSQFVSNSQAVSIRNELVSEQGIGSAPAVYSEVTASMSLPDSVEQQDQIVSNRSFNTVLEASSDKPSSSELATEDTEFGEVVASATTDISSGRKTTGENGPLSAAYSTESDAGDSTSQIDSTVGTAEVGERVDQPISSDAADISEPRIVAVGDDSVAMTDAEIRELIAQEIALAAKLYEDGQQAAKAQQELVEEQAELQLQTSIDQATVNHQVSQGGLEANLKSQLENAENAMKGKLASASASLNLAIRQADSTYQRGVSSAKTQKAGMEHNAHNERDKATKSAKSWYQKAINKLPSWMRKIASKIKKWVSGLKSKLKYISNKFTAALGHAVNWFNSRVKVLRDTWVAAKNSASAFYVQAKKEILAERDRVVKSFQKDYDEALDRALENRDSLIEKAVKIRDDVVRESEEALQVVVQKTEEAFKTQLTSEKLFSNLSEKMLATGRKLDEKVLQYMLDVVKDPLGESMNLIGDPTKGLRGVTSLLDEAWFDGKLTEAAHRVVDPAVQSYFESNIAAYVDTDFGSHKYSEVGRELGGQPVYHVNGIDTDKKLAVEQVNAISERLGRPVRLIHNPTANKAEDALQAAGEWLLSGLLQTSGTTKTIAGMFLHHAKKGETVSITAHSQGTIMVRNAIQTVERLGYQEWLRTKVRFVAFGTPLRDVMFPHAEKVTKINENGDIINILGNLEQNPFGSFNGELEYTNGTQIHDLIRTYVVQLKNEMLWPVWSDPVTGRPTVSLGLAGATTPIGSHFGETIVGSGQIDAVIAGGVGTLIRLTGDLAVGDASSPVGFRTDGFLEVGSHTATLLDTNQAALGELTTLGDGASPGTLISDQGLAVSLTGNIKGYGTILTANDATVINNGNIIGTSSEQPITINSRVKGVGTFDNVVINGQFDPDFSPTLQKSGTVAYADLNRLVIELGGRLAGAEYDRVEHYLAKLGGTLEVQLIDGFKPALGDLFEVITSEQAFEGDFSEILLPLQQNGVRVRELLGQHGIDLEAEFDVSDTLEVLKSQAADYQIAGHDGSGLKVQGDRFRAFVTSLHQFVAEHPWHTEELEIEGGKLVQIATDGVNRLIIEGSNWKNFVEPSDVNNDQNVTALDALTVINELGRRSHSDDLTAVLNDAAILVTGEGHFYDQNGDGKCTALDALRVINELARSSVSGEGEAVTADYLSAGSNAIWSQDMEVNEDPFESEFEETDLIYSDADPDTSDASDRSEDLVYATAGPEATDAVDSLLGDLSDWWK